MKRTFQPSNLVRKRRHGFRLRMAIGRNALQERLDAIEDLRGDALLRLQGIDHDATLRLGGGDIEKGLAALLMSFGLFALETIRRDRLPLAPSLGAGKAELGGDIENDGAIRHGAVDQIGRAHV